MVSQPDSHPLNSLKQTFEVKTSRPGLLAKVPALLYDFQFETLPCCDQPERSGEELG